MRTLIAVSFVTTFLFMTSFSALAALDPNLILYFTFDEQLDGRVIEDMTGGGNDGKLRLGATITKEPAEVYKGAGALKISGNISQQFRVEPFDRMNQYQDHTVAFWIYFFEGFHQGEARSILKKNADEAQVLNAGFSKSPSVQISSNSFALFYEVGEQGGIDGLGPDGKGSEFELKKWYHIVGVKKGSDLIIYIDGEEEGIFDVPKKFPQGDGRLRIGGTRTRAAYFAMDEFALFDRPLTEIEVELMEQGVFLSVEPQDKLTATWGRLKTGR
ncbi:LamG domain-containing protein [Candidatus Poribacteria bacterium]|nr:LamG domain-containing protein [Candidatus Poribacteria bacterium]